MAKWVCSVCGYVYEGETAPEKCPVCKAPASKFLKQDSEKVWAAEHVVGVASDAPEDIKKDLRDMFNGECSDFWAKLLPTAPRRIWSCVQMLNTALLRDVLIWLREPKPSIWMPFMTSFMRLAAMKRDTEKVLKVF